MLAIGRASDANQALEYSLTGDVILRHRNRNRPRDEHSLLCVLDLRSVKVLYTRTIKRKLNSPVRSPTEDNKPQWPQENTQPRSSRVLCTKAVYANQTLIFVHLHTLLIPSAGENRKRTPKHQLLRRHPRERQQGQHRRHHRSWQERSHHWRHRRREDAHWWPRERQRPHGFQPGCRGYRWRGARWC